MFHLCFPVRYEDEATLKMGAEDIRACIKFIEEKTGAQWSWDAYFSAMKRFNEETKYELEKWEVNKTAYPSCWVPATSCSASGTMRWTAVLIPVS